MESELLTWGDLLAIVRHLPATSALQRAIHGDEVEWNTTNQLLANVADSAAWLVWSKTSDASRKPPRNQPKPIPRPGVEDTSKKQIGSDALPAAEMAAWLGWAE